MAARRRGGSTPPRQWESFRRTRTGVNRLTGEETPVPDEIEMWGNNLYNVLIRHLEPLGEDAPPMAWVSINRKDRKTVRDWRHLQRIKNELVGPECEAVELFPAESRLVDTSNQFHLFVITDPEYRFPFGYEEREVRTPEQVAIEAPGAVQRPFDEEDT